MKNITISIVYRMGKFHKKEVFGTQFVVHHLSK